MLDETNRTVKQLHKNYGIADIAPGRKRESQRINNVLT